MIISFELRTLNNFEAECQRFSAAKRCEVIKLLVLLAQVVDVLNYMQQGGLWSVPSGTADTKDQTTCQHCMISYTCKDTNEAIQVISTLKLTTVHIN